MSNFVSLLLVYPLGGLGSYVCYIYRVILEREGRDREGYQEINRQRRRERVLKRNSEINKSNEKREIGVRGGREILSELQRERDIREEEKLWNEEERATQREGGFRLQLVRGVRKREMG